MPVVGGTAKSSLGEEVVNPNDSQGQLTSLSSPGPLPPLGCRAHPCSCPHEGPFETQGDVMSNKKVWFITGAGRGMGVDFARAALEAGHAVVASGRDSDRVSKALG